MTSYKELLKKVFLMAVTLGIFGCALNSSIVADKVKLKLRLNMSEQDVTKLLGKPFNINQEVEGDKLTEIWTYRTYYFITWPDFKKEEDFTKLYFQDGILVNWYGHN